MLGPGTGQGDVFASRDSYLALHPEYCTFEGHQTDPVRGVPREQMSYQWVGYDKDLPLPDLDAKFHEWAVATLGSAKNYEFLQSKTWTYFQHFDRVGLALQAPWNVLELQGRNRTLFVHASNFFESVLDIVNYNNMLVDGLSGKLNELGHPKSDAKPQYYQTDYLADPAAVWRDAARRAAYLKMYGNICYDTRDQYINFPWSSERKGLD